MAPTEPSGISKRTRLTALIVACVLFMQDLDSTVIATALPTMAKAFATDTVRMNVALTAYLLSVAIFIPASGWFADHFGSRRVFRGAIVLFTVASLLCSLADSLSFLVIARILQGAGGGLMLPVGRLVVLRTAPRHELVAAIAWVTTPALIGPMLGAPVGGLIVTYYSWRWIFYVNLPIGLMGIILASLFIEDSRRPQSHAFDATGFVLAASALSCLTLGLEIAGSGLLPRWVAGALMGAGGVATVHYVRHAHRHDAPILDLSLMRLALFRATMLAMMIFRIGTGAIPLLLPLMLQVGFGASAIHSGLLTFASSAGALVMRPIAQSVLRWWGFRYTLIWNGVVSATLIACCGAFRPTWPAAAMYTVLLVGGFFRSLQFTAYSSLAYGEVPQPRMSAATSLFSSAQQLAVALSVPLAALVLSVSTTISGHASARPSDFSLAFSVTSLLMLCAASVGLLIPATAGDDLARRTS
jgi:EmrB/QacA subfamily drug resistance transporter